MSESSISLSDRAARRVGQFLAEQGGQGLRLGLRRTGCSGWAYVVELADEIRDQDELFSDHGIRIVVDRKALPMLAGTHVDFVQQGLNSTFEFNNPNVTDECGCGESVAIGTKS